MTLWAQHFTDAFEGADYVVLPGHRVICTELLTGVISEHQETAN